MPTRLLVLVLALSSAAALPGCDLPLAEGCARHSGCASCAGDLACGWTGGACEPIFDRDDGAVTGAIIDPQFCPGAEPLSCSLDDAGAYCPSGQCLGGVCVRAVTGTVGWRYWKPDGTTELVPPGPSGYTVTAHSFTADARWETLTVPDAATGAYTVFVPFGEATLTLWDPVGHPHSTVTAASAVDFVRDVAGRPDETFPTGSATLRLLLSNLLSWDSGSSSGLADEVQLTTSGGYAGWLTGTNAGATMLPFDFSLQGWPLHAPAAGDWALVYQRANRSWTASNGSGTWNYLAALRGGALSYTCADVPWQQVDLWLSPLSTATVSFDWRFADLYQHVPSLGSGVNTWGFAASVSAHPYTLAREVMPPSELLYLPVGAPRQDTVTGPLAYGRPGFPGAYEVALAELSAQVPAYAPGASEPAYIQALLRREAAVTATVATAPALGPVAWVRHEDWSSAFAPRTGVGLRPLLRWGAPAVGVPSAYVVRVHRLENDAGMTRHTVVGQVVTAATSVQLPPGFLEFGGTYVATVSARMGNGNLVTEPLRQPGWPRAIARVVTASFSP
jgi:hypothetical protein